MFLIKISLLLLFALLSACSGTIPLEQPTPTAPLPAGTPLPVSIKLNELFTLEAGQRGQMEAAGLTIELQSILRDWRCPTQVECSEAGAVDLAIYVWLTGLEPTRFELSTNPAIHQDVLSYGDYEIRLLAVDPYPETPEQTLLLEEYRVTLLVSQKSE